MTRHAHTLVMGHDNMPCDPMAHVRKFEFNNLIEFTDCVMCQLCLEQGWAVNLPPYAKLVNNKIAQQQGLEVTP